MRKETMKHYLHIEISKIQITEKENDQRHRKEKTKHREIIRSIINDKAYDRIHQEHKAIQTNVRTQVLFEHCNIHDYQSSCAP